MKFENEFQPTCTGECNQSGQQVAIDFASPPTRRMIRFGEKNQRAWTGGCVPLLRGRWRASGFSPTTYTRYHLSYSHSLISLHLGFFYIESGLLFLHGNSAGQRWN